GTADVTTHKLYILDLGREGSPESTLDGGRELLTYVHIRRHFDGSLGAILAVSMEAVLRTRCLTFR
ncbi:hypothetical protein DICSQDRAFT_73109, partial [Dichomitus squalens LYAD-421 SS1]